LFQTLHIIVFNKTDPGGLFHHKMLLSEKRERKNKKKKKTKKQKANLIIESGRFFSTLGLGPLL
jgi:hypothetical protein